MRIGQREQHLDKLSLAKVFEVGSRNSFNVIQRDFNFYETQEEKKSCITLKTDTLPVENIEYRNRRAQMPELITAEIRRQAAPQQSQSLRRLQDKTRKEVLKL